MELTEVTESGLEVTNRRVAALATLTSLAVGIAAGSVEQGTQPDAINHDDILKALLGGSAFGLALTAGMGATFGFVHWMRRFEHQ